MSCRVEETDTFGRKLHIDIPAADFKKQIDSELRKLSGKAKIKGFRPGKAPLEIVKRYYGSEIRGEVVNTLMYQSYQDAMTEHSFRSMIAPNFDDIKIDEDEGISYTAYIEVIPDLQLQSLDNMTIEKPMCEIVEADVDKMVERVRKNHAKWQDKTGTACVGDRLKVDISRQKDDGSPDETLEDQSFVLGSDVVAPGFDKQLENVRAGETKAVEASYPDDYKYPNLAGQTRQYQVHVKSVEEAILPELNEDFFKLCKIEEGGLDALRSLLREGMEAQLKQKLTLMRRAKVKDAMAEQNDIPIPTGMLKEQIKAMRGRLLQNNPKMTSDDKAYLSDELFKETASRQVRLNILFFYIADKHNLKSDRQSCEAKINEIVQDYEDPQKMGDYYFKNTNAYETIEALVLEDKVAEQLISQAKVVEKKYSFYDIIDY